MKLKQLCDAAGIDCPAARQNDEVAAIATNSSRVTKNSLFVCIRGLHTDGHAFAAEAAERGARWIVCEEGSAVDEKANITYFYVDNPRKVLAYLFHAWYGCPCDKLKLIGVTGTNGKSSVTQMIARILADAGKRCGLIGTLGCFLDGQKMQIEHGDPLANMTTPDPEALYKTLAEMAGGGAEYAVMEVSSHALALEKVAPMQFEIGVFTNLTPEHLDFHGDMEKYAFAKTRLFAQSNISIINIDQPDAAKMIAAARGKTLTCSTNRSESDYIASDINLLGGAGISYRLSAPNGTLFVTSPIPGHFTVENTMQAAATALTLGIDPASICKTLAEMQGVSGRMERVKLPHGADFTVLIDYAHTPDALENLLRTAREMRSENSRIVLLFGCGGDRDRQKRPVMGKIASELADHIILTSDNSRTEDKQEILRQILGGMDLNTPCTVISDRRDAIRYAVWTAQKGDIILLAGKGHEEYEIDAMGRRFFSEKEITREAYELRRKNI